MTKLNEIAVGDCRGGAASISDTTVTTLVSAPAAGRRFCITTIIIDSSGISAAVRATIGGTSFATAPVIPVPAGSGVVVALPHPIRGALATAITVTLSGSPSAAVNVTINGFEDGT